MTPEAFGIAPGTVLAGKYRVERVLGSGGMGFVVAALHLELQHLVAVKFLHGTMMTNGEAVARFAREARAAARIKSEHVARVLDVGRLDEGAPYTVMEFLQGQDLGALLLERGPLPVDLAVEYVLQACHAIAEAHAAGIVHRDLKPSNLFLTASSDGVGIIKVLDFGISKLTTAASFEPQLTSTKSSMGSPLYMSPEQMKSFRDADHRTDIWALGVILYELTCGKPPFDAGSLPELIMALVMSTPAALSAQRPEVPSGLEAVVMRCLEKDPAQRYPSVGELARELLPFAPQNSRSLVERVSRLSGSHPPATPEPRGLVGVDGANIDAALPRMGVATDSPWTATRAARAPGLRKSVVFAVGALLVVGAAALGAWALRGSTAAVASSAAAVSSAPNAQLLPEPKGEPSTASAPAVPLAATAPAPAASAPAPSHAVVTEHAARHATRSQAPAAKATDRVSKVSVTPAESGARRRTLDIDLK